MSIRKEFCVGEIYGSKKHQKGNPNYEERLIVSMNPVIPENMKSNTDTNCLKYVVMNGDRKDLTYIVTRASFVKWVGEKVGYQDVTPEVLLDDNKVQKSSKGRHCSPEGPKDGRDRRGRKPKDPNTISKKAGRKPGAKNKPKGIVVHDTSGSPLCSSGHSIVSNNDCVRLDIESMHGPEQVPKALDVASNITLHSEAHPNSILEGNGILAISGNIIIPTESEACNGFLISPTLWYWIKKNFRYFAGRDITICIKDANEQELEVNRKTEMVFKGGRYVVKEQVCQ